MERIYKTLRRQRAYEGKIEHLVVYPFFNCNIRCSYCYYWKERSEKLSQKKFDKALSIFLKISKNPRITFLGGEPTLDTKALVSYIKKAREKIKNIPITIFTNGTHLNKNLSKFIKEENINLVVSLDGDKDINDFSKKYFKKSHYELAISNLKKFELIPYSSVNMVVTRKNIKNLSRNIIHLKKIGFNSFGFNINYGELWKENDIKILKEQINRIFRDYAQLIKRGEMYKFSNIYEILYSLKGEKIPYCSNLILMPDGNFYPCDKIISSDPKTIKKFILKGNILSKRRKFFNKMRKKGLVDKQLFCKIGLYLYFKYILAIKDSELKKRFKIATKMQNTFKNSMKKYIALFFKLPQFRKLHNI
ncbi:MAG: radical SAM protein [Elusimicrobiota bacterium]